MINELFNKIDLTSFGRFDVIQLNQVLEHFSDPKGTLNICHKLLKPGGLLFISVANEYNPFQEIVTSYLDYSHCWVTLPQHINYFSLKTIKKLVVLYDFKILNTTSTFPINIFLLMEDKYINNNSLGKICHKRRKNLELALTKSGNISMKQNINKAL